MILETSNNYYEVLEVSPDASQQEIRQAYLRLKLAYSKDSAALYSLVNKEEMEEILKRIEEAYQVLSNEEKRRDYDRNHSSVSEPESPFMSRPSKKERQADDRVVSIDRVPPMDKHSREEDLLVAPATDFSGSAIQNMGTPSLESLGGAAGFGTSLSATVAPSRRHDESRQSAPASSSSSGIDSQLQEEIDRESEWPGAFLRKVREARRISVEEMADYTKVSKGYLLAIENEDFTRLPAATFVRGFVIQVAKKLRLPHDKVAASYISRYRKACPDKA